MNRRALLRVAAGVLGGGAATAAGLSVATESAAQTGLTLDVDGDSAEIGTDGSVSEVQLDLDQRHRDADGDAGRRRRLGVRGGRRRRQPVDQHRIAACDPVFFQRSDV